ncbi:MAG TPA: murein biosynthesis integral membrane protein MurJ [Gemmatimonadota bacterium]|nr:murein biosynthesis integral membrane protein MurJ [Gemmatimonadota bacterium]
MLTTGVRRSPGSDRATAVVMFGIGVSRIFGLVREQVIAFYFGRAAQYSAFVAAYRIPNLVRVLLGEGNLSSSFIPVLAERMRSADPSEARRLAGSVLGLLLLVIGIVTLAGMAAAPALAWIVAPGFDPELRALVERLIIILFPIVAFMVTGAWCMGVLHAHGRFFWPNFAPLFMSVVSAGALIAFVGRTEVDPILILAWGVVAGSLVQLLVQLPATRAVLGSLSPRGRWREPAVGRVVTLFLPMVVGTGVGQLSTLIDVQIASFLDQESVATLAYAQRLYLVPLSLFSVAIAQVALPTLSHQVVARPPDAVRDELSRAFHRMAFFLLPSTLGLAAFGRPAVSVLFERGRFDAGDTDAVAWVLTAYAVALLAYGSVRLYATAFYALQDTRTPVRVAVVALAANGALGITLAWLVGIFGIALATGLAATLNVILLAGKLRNRIGTILTSAVRRDVGRMVVALAVSSAAGAVPYLWILSEWPGWGLGSRIAATAGLYLGVGGAYIAAARLLGVSLHVRRRSSR